MFEDFQNKGVFYELIYLPLSPKWFEHRKKRVSATGVGSVCRRNKFRTREQYMDSFINPVVETYNYDMERGNTNESLSADLYSKETGYTLRMGSLCINPEFTDLCATPDRFILDENGYDTDRLVEIKSPRKFADYIYDNYYLQFLTQMWVTGKDKLDYVQYVDGENRIMEVKWNQKHWDDTFTEIKTFVDELRSRLP
jgi:predicted phage-related endonuclease